MTRMLVLSMFCLLGCKGGVEDSGQGPVDLDHDGWVETDDCDDENASVHPGASEVCDGIDNDCDGYVDDDDPSAEGRMDRAMDADGDGWGSMEPRDQQSFCADPGEGWVTAERALDCDDDDASIHPDALEVCNTIDDDCDGEIDEKGALDSTWYLDSDNDGYGDEDLALVQCEQPSGYVLQGADCDDNDPLVFPGATELCNGKDDDCDGAVDVDAEDMPTWYRDGDDDGYGSATETITACDQPARYVSVSGDCDDGSPSVNPGAHETCDGVDQDCDGVVDNDAVNAPTWHPDDDGDGFGDGSVSQSACEEPTGWVVDAMDCDDDDPEVFPGADELCNGADDDCDGVVDEGAPSENVWYPDSDGDGYGNGAMGATACSAPSGYVSNGSDCDDSSALVYPGATEICDGEDNDCDGTVDGDGLVSFVSPGGSVTDLSAGFASGTASSAYDAEILSSGTLSLCPGTYHAHIHAKGGSLAVVGVDGAADTALEGDGTASVIAAYSGLSSLSIQGLTVSLGEASHGGCVDGSDHGVSLVLDDVVLSDCSATADGGGLYLANGTLTATDLALEGNSAADYGGGASIEGSTVSLGASSASGNTATYGGGIVLRTSTATLSAVELSANEVSYAGGGLYLSGSSVQISTTAIHSNLADGDASGRDAVGGGVFLTGGADLTCQGTTSGSYGAWSNQAAYGGGVFLYDSASTLASDACDWGNGSSDNDPDDVAIYVSTLSYTTFGNNVDFSCDSTGCI